MDRFSWDGAIGRMRRRGFLVGAGALAGLGVAGEFSSRVLARPIFSDYPFKLGVASGDPRPDGAVLWTRLAPDPLGGGGVPNVPIPVQWQVATDENLRNVVQSGTVYALPKRAHSVHVQVRGLQPNRWYWYRFRVGGELSRIGRTRTAPAPGARVNQLKFAVASCQDWQNGFYSAYRNMAQEDLDMVVFLGDYIYEYGPEDSTGPRQHNGPEILTLEDYRNRHALYKTDPALQQVHALFPWIVTWDDHEVENNYANLVAEASSQQAGDPEAFAQRRANGYQAYYEHMPLAAFSIPRGPDLQLYRRVTFGDLAQFNVLDTRQFRTDQPCGDELKPRCEEAFDPAATLTGSRQEGWLFKGLASSPATWNVLVQQVIFAQFDFDPTPESELFNLDQWDGYVAARGRVTDFLQQRKIANPVVLTGDIHSSWAFDLKTNFDDPASPTVGAEFVCTSITSDFPSEFIAPVQAALPANPHTKYFDGAFRGYARCTLSQDRWQTDFRGVASILDPAASISTLASFVLENGRPGVQPA
ncbi:MAG: alkaline phosphatase [Aphanocapsa lilacina HA4352-LM1]|nr:alkaline phosphatase [Aphanocapsa lilacina HA4352-LM1]